MSLRVTRRGFLAAVMLFMPAARLGAQQGTLSGTVRSGGTPLGFAAVAVFAGDSVRSQTRADESGLYRIALHSGVYTIVFRFPGFAPSRVPGVRIDASTSTTLDADLVPKAFGLDEVMVTAARRSETSRDAIASVAVVTESTIRDRTGLTPLDFAMHTPGVDVAVQGLQGRQLVARGFNATLSSSLLLLTDYRNASLPAPRANLSYFMSPTADDIERVEIVRGPVSALYGPNAADGVVHFLTKSPFDSPGTNLSVTAGGRSVIEGAGRFASVVNNRVAYKISGTYFRGDEWPSPRNPLETIARDPVTERASGEFRADLRLSPTATAILTLGSAKAIRVLDYTSIGAYEVRDWRTDFAQLRFSDGKLFAQAYWNANPGGGTSTSMQTGAVTLDHTSILAAQIRHGVDLGTRSTLDYGVDLQRTDPQSLGTIDGRFEQDDISLEVGAYAQASTHLTPKLLLQAAARVDDHNRLNGPVFSPRLGLAYTPAEGHTVRLSYNRAFSTPSPLQLFADILAARLDPLPYGLRAVGVPKDGFQFARDCAGGLCVSSPFAPGQRLPADATLLWPAVVQIMRGAGVDLSGIPAPKTSDVGTALRVLDLSAGVYRAFTGQVRNLPALTPTITNSLEAGYKGLLGEHLLVDAAVYATRRQNFIAPIAVVTPNVFLATSSLAAYLARYMPAAQASALAAGIGGVDGDPKATGIPLATVGPTGLLAGSDILLSYQNIGDVRLWGTDLSAEFAASDHVTITGGYSWVNKNFFAATATGGADLSTNAPKNKAIASVRYHQPANDLTAEVRARYVGEFRMVDGILIGDVPSFTVADVDAGIAVPGVAGARFTLSVQNIADARHTEFFGHPILGRLVLTRLQYRF